MYEIKSKSDLSTGLSLVVSVPEQDIDTKALYTISADMPKFILPFRYKYIDGNIELTYATGVKNKLQYSYGSRLPQEYAAFWTGVLSPLLECEDWFMNPFCFVMQSDYLYYDKSDGSISYLYIPSIHECADAEALKRLAVELAEKCPSSNSELEIRALRSIMQDFNPKQFLQMLHSYKTTNTPIVSDNRIDRPDVSRPSPAPMPSQASIPMSPAPQRSKASEYAAPIAAASDDIVIDLQAGKAGKPEKKKPDKNKPKGGLFGSKSENKTQEKPQKSKGGLFGKKKSEPQELMLGAAANSDPLPSYGNDRVERHEPPVSDSPENEFTQFEDSEAINLASATAKFRLVGNAAMPSEIIIRCAPGKAFVIGRFDITKGKQQADFEFDKSTRAVSRRHAVIEYSGQGYEIIDLSSSAGTFVDGQRLPPNVPYKLSFGMRVSFGTAGADYIFEG